MVKSDLMEWVAEDPEGARTAVLQALEAHGTRAGAADYLETTVRTLARAMTALKLTGLMENSNNGAADRLREWREGEYAAGRYPDTGAAAEYLYGSNTPVHRMRVLSLLRAMK